MRRNTIIAYLLLLSTIIFFANLSGCASTLFTDKNEKDKETQHKNTAEKEDTSAIPKVAFIPFDYSVEIGKQKAAEALSIIATCMMERKSFQPLSLKEWTKQSYGKKKAKNIFQIIEAVKKVKLPIDSICHGMVFKSGHKFGIFLSYYPLKPGLKPSYYYRSFSNFNSLMKVGRHIIGEMEKRASSFTSPLLNKTIFVNKFNINFYGFTNIKSGEGAIIPIPYLDINGVTYKDTDHFFHQILLYNLHATRLVKVWNSKMSNYIIKKSHVPTHVDYIVSVNLDISDKISRFATVVRSNKSNRIIFTYEYPFESLELDNLYRTIRNNARMIILSLLNNTEQKKVGTVSLDAVEFYQPVFCDNYYLGEGQIENLLLPAGNAEIVISSERYRIFISPFLINKHIYKLKDYFILDSKLQRKRR